MNKVERQILENQLIIINGLQLFKQCKKIEEDLEKNWLNTYRLLNPSNDKKNDQSLFNYGEKEEKKKERYNKKFVNSGENKQ